MICGDGWGEVIPSFDGTDFSQFEKRVRLFESNTRVAPQRRVGKLLERLEGRAFDLREVSQDLETPKGVEILLDHLRLHFERQPDEEADVFESCMPPTMIYGSMVVNGAKFSHHGTKSRLGGTLACWTPAKAKPKDRLMWGAGESRRLSIGASDRGPSAICGHNLSWWRSMPPRSQLASSARSVVRLSTATLWTCRRSSCVSPTSVCWASSGLRISRALRRCALLYRTWTTPLSMIAATRSCGQATRVQLRAVLCTRCRRYRANVLLPARWCCVRNTACLRTFAMLSTKG